MKKTIALLTGCLFWICCIPDHGTDVHEKINIHLYISGPGSVTGVPDDSCVVRGDTIVLTAAADSDAVFTGWYAGRFVAANPLSLPVEQELTVRAVFVRRPGNMAFIPARDSVFMMGAADLGAPAIEKPQHAVKCTHDYFIGACEVTVAEYRGAAGGTAATGDSLPVTNLSWYDAVRYCNRRSIREGYDTVYSYTARCPQAGACPYILENLVTHYDRFGYRLPTEAEWEYACRAGSDGTFFWGNAESDASLYAWYFGNAENRLHPAGGKLPNAYGLYDMAGNAAEWVNDWLGLYDDSAAIDPVGPTHLTQRQFETSWERPLRGGSYRLSAKFLRSSLRKGPYDMTFAGAQTDIGFRVALGAFDAPPGRPEVAAPDSLLAAVVARTSDLISLVGTHRIKTAFVYTAGRNRKCAYVDFDASPVQIVRCGDDSAVCAPSISPDGKYIAWGSTVEGSPGPGTITIRSLGSDFAVTARMPGCLPRWWVHPQTADTFLIYTDGASQDDSPQWSREKTMRQRISAGIPRDDPEVLWDKGSYHGGLSSDGRFLGTAFPFAKLVDLGLGDTNIYYFMPPWNGMTDTPQVCNLSMSPSRSEPGEALFLDFGYEDVSTLVGKSYGIHAILFVANTRLFSSEHVSRWFEAPQGYDRWNFTEWTNWPGAACALAQTTSGGDDDAVVLIQCRDSAYCTLLRGKELRDVSVWINPADVSEVDDPYRYFGRYDIPIQTAGQEPLAKKLRLFWHVRERVSCIAIGNSPTYYGFNPHGVAAFPAVNIGWPQSSIGASITIALQYVLPHTPGLRAIVLDLDAAYFDVDCATSLPRLTGLYDSKGYELDAGNSFYRGGLPQAAVGRAAGWGVESWSGFDSAGALPDSIVGNGWGEPIVEGTGYSIDDTIVRANIAFLQEMLDSAAQKNVQVLAVNYPQNPRYRETGMVGRVGPDRATYRQLEAILREIEQRNPNFHLFDANNFGDHDYTDDEAFDTNHLNSRGGLKLAARVDSILQVILK